MWLSRSIVEIQIVYVLEVVLEPTMLRFCIGGSETCVCAEGGRGGITYCPKLIKFLLLLQSKWFPVIKTDNNPRGIICNRCNGAWVACAYGGEINVYGLNLVWSAFVVIPCICMFNHHSHSVGQGSKEGRMIVYTNDDGNGSLSMVRSRSSPTQIRIRIVVDSQAAYSGHPVGVRWCLWMLQQ